MGRSLQPRFVCKKKTDSNPQSGGWNTRREFASEQAAHQGGLRPGRPASEPTRSGEWFSRNDRSCDGLRCKVHDDRKEFVASISNHSQLASESSGPPRYARFRELQVIRSTPLESRRRLRPGALGAYPFIPNGKVTHCTDPYRNMSGQRLRKL